MPDCKNYMCKESMAVKKIMEEFSHEMEMRNDEEQALLSAAADTYAHRMWQRNRRKRYRKKHYK